MEFENLCQEARSEGPNWEATRTAFETIFKTMPTSDVSRLVMTYVRLYLPKFLEKNPQETWANERVATIQRVLDGELNPSEIPRFPEGNKMFDDPLARAFTAAIFRFWNMMRPVPRHYSFAESAVYIIWMIFRLLGYAYPNWLPAEYEHLRSEGKDRSEYQADLWCDLASKLADIVSPTDEQISID
jgi:hypothetical protein